MCCVPHSADRIKRDFLSPVLLKGWAFFWQNHAEIVPTPYFFGFHSRAGQCFTSADFLKLHFSILLGENAQEGVEIVSGNVIRVPVIRTPSTGVGVASAGRMFSASGRRA